MSLVPQSRVKPAGCLRRFSIRQCAMLQSRVLDISVNDRFEQPTGSDGLKSEGDRW